MQSLAFLDVCLELKVLHVFSKCTKKLLALVVSSYSIYRQNKILMVWDDVIDLKILIVWDDVP